MMKKTVKKKGYLIDKITEDSFYENLLLGLPTFLKSWPFVSQINLERRCPVSMEEISSWECSNNFLLPLDLRNFYLSCSGFSFTYNFKYDKDESEEISHVEAGIVVNSLQNLAKITPNEAQPNVSVYVLSQIYDGSCVVLAQFNQPTKPATIWLFYKMKQFYFLCCDFVTYLRMALAHLAVPGWQFSVLKGSLPEWSAEMFQMMAPGVLQEQIYDCKIENNILDMAIFDVQEESEAILPTEDGDGKLKSKKKVPKTKIKK